MLQRLMSNLQVRLQQLYELSVPHDINHFLITDPVLLRELDHSNHKRYSPEKLLIRQIGDNLDVTLYVEESVVASLLNQDPEIKLDEKNLTDYLVALEGVSHFIYLLWNAAYKRSISLFELELQAEVDKFVTAMVLIGGQNHKHFSIDLHNRLFRDVRYAKDLDDDEKQRYEMANHFAATYCDYLIRRYPEAPLRLDLVNDVRRFYRMTRNGKLNYINLSK